MSFVFVRDDVNKMLGETGKPAVGLEAGCPDTVRRWRQAQADDPYILPAVAYRHVGPSHLPHEPQVI